MSKNHEVAAPLTQHEDPLAESPLKCPHCAMQASIENRVERLALEKDCPPTRKIEARAGLQPVPMRAEFHLQKLSWLE